MVINYLLSQTVYLDKINIHCDIITNSIASSSHENILVIILTDNLSRSYPFKYEPRRLLYNEVSKLNRNEIRIYITDTKSRPIDLQCKELNRGHPTLISQ